VHYLTKKQRYSILQFIVIGVFASLPLITVTQTIGIDLFLDSFDHPEKYHYAANSQLYERPGSLENKCLILQRASHPEFAVHSGDIILFYSQSGIACDAVAITTQGPIKKIYTENTLTTQYPYPLYDHDIIGKVVASTDNNLWNSIAFSFWQTATTDLNIRALLTSS